VAARRAVAPRAHHARARDVPVHCVGAVRHQYFRRDLESTSRRGARQDGDGAGIEPGRYADTVADRGDRSCGMARGAGAPVGGIRRGSPVRGVDRAAADHAADRGPRHADCAWGGGGRGPRHAGCACWGGVAIRDRARGARGRRRAGASDSIRRVVSAPARGSDRTDRRAQRDGAGPRARSRPELQRGGQRDGRPARSPERHVEVSAPRVRRRAYHADPLADGPDAARRVHRRDRNGHGAVCDVDPPVRRLLVPDDHDGDGADVRDADCGVAESGRGAMDWGRRRCARRGAATVTRRAGERVLQLSAISHHADRIDDAGGDGAGVARHPGQFRGCAYQILGGRIEPGAPIAFIDEGGAVRVE